MQILADIRAGAACGAGAGPPPPGYDCFVVVDGEAEVWDIQDDGTEELVAVRPVSEQPDSKEGEKGPSALHRGRKELGADAYG